VGVDYTGIGGLGVVFNKTMLKNCFSTGIFSVEEWQYDYHSCMDKTGFEWAEGGSYSYTGDDDDLTIYLLLKGATLTEVLHNEEEFIVKVMGLGVSITRDDIKIIEDIHVW